MICPEDLATTYDTNIHGVNRFKVRDRIQAAISKITSAQNQMTDSERQQFAIMLEDFDEDCD